MNKGGTQNIGKENLSEILLLLGERLKLVFPEIEWKLIGYISRIDQIFLKLYASVDRGGYHVDDLIKLEPSDIELLDASHWVCNQDTSETFFLLLKSMLKQIGYENVAGKL